MLDLYIYIYINYILVFLQHANALSTVEGYRGYGAEQGHMVA